MRPGVVLTQAGILQAGIVLTQAGILQAGMVLMQAGILQAGMVLMQAGILLAAGRQTAGNMYRQAARRKKMLQMNRRLRLI